MRNYEHNSYLTQWGWNIVQVTFSNAFSWMKIIQLWLKFYRCLIVRVQLTISHYWFRNRLYCTCYCQLLDNVTIQPLATGMSYWNTIIHIIHYKESFHLCILYPFLFNKPVRGFNLIKIYTIYIFSKSSICYHPCINNKKVIIYSLHFPTVQWHLQCHPNRWVKLTSTKTQQKASVYFFLKICCMQSPVALLITKDQGPIHKFIIEILQKLMF